MKQAVIALGMLYLLYPLNGTVEGYPREKFVEDLVDGVCACRGELQRHKVMLIILRWSGIARRMSADASRRGRRGCRWISLQVWWSLQTVVVRSTKGDSYPEHPIRSDREHLGRLASKNDPRNPWTGVQLHNTFTDLNNKWVSSTQSITQTSANLHPYAESSTAFPPPSAKTSASILALAASAIASTRTKSPTPLSCPRSSK